MAQTIYTSTRDVDVRKCEPQPLLRLNYFNEFRTEVEKAKARKALGIPDSYSLLWGNIQGFLEQQKDLVKFIEDSFNYSVENYENIKTVQEALNYLFDVVTDYYSHKEEFELTKIDILNCQNSIIELLGILNNLISLIEPLQNNINGINTEITRISETVLQHNESIQRIELSFDGNVLYTTDLDDSLTVVSTIGGILKGTKVSDLEGKSINAIFDLLLFPTVIRDLVKPSLLYSPSSLLIEVNTSGTKPTLRFNQNDAGPENNRTEVITFNGNTYESLSSYNQVGTYKYLGTVSYDAGEYLRDNKGLLTDKRIEAGTLNTTSTINVTYPWFAGNTTGVEKQVLVPIGKDSGELEISLIGQAVIKLPENTEVKSFTVNGGLGFLEVDLSGWDTSTETIGGYKYKVWTKKDSYLDNLPHRINFLLS